MGPILLKRSLILMKNQKITDKKINLLSKTTDFIKMIDLLNKTDDFIKMINSLSKTDDFMKNDKFS